MSVQQQHRVWPGAFGKLSDAQHRRIDRASVGLDLEKRTAYFLRIHSALHRIRGKPSDDDVDRAITSARRGLVQIAERDVARETLPTA